MCQGNGEVTLTHPFWVIFKINMEKLQKSTLNFTAFCI